MNFNFVITHPIWAIRSRCKVLGNNKFLFGDDPCDEDCCIFGFTTFILYNIPMNFYHGAMKEKFPNLVDSPRYCFSLCLFTDPLPVGRAQSQDEGEVLAGL